MKRLSREVFVATVLVLAAVLGGCGASDDGPNPASSGTLDYSVIARDGGIVATVADERPGPHTVWVVLDDPPKGRHREVVCVIDNDVQGGENVNAGGDAPMPAGTYSYKIYSADRVVNTAGAAYWTPDNQVGSGRVEVP